jgi:hypothetical protein
MTTGGAKFGGHTTTTPFIIITFFVVVFSFFPFTYGKHKRR